MSNETNNTKEIQGKMSSSTYCKILEKLLIEGKCMFHPKEIGITLEETKLPENQPHVESCITCTLRSIILTSPAENTKLTPEIVDDRTRLHLMTLTNMTCPHGHSPTKKPQGSCDWCYSKAVILEMYDIVFEEAHTEKSKDKILELYEQNKS